MDDTFWMYQALAEARRAAVQGEVPIGAVVGAAYGFSMGVSIATISALQIAAYPVYMANCAVGPFVRLAAPIYVPPITGALGMLVGAGYKMLKKLT